MIAFEKLAAERLVRKMKLSMTPEIEAQLKVLFRSVKEGDFCCRIENWNLPKPLWEDGCEDNPFPKSPLIIQGNRLYLQKTWALETLIIQKIVTLLRRPVSKIDSVRFQESLSKMGDRLNTSQQQATQRAFAKSFAIFTGGPGTGKSYTAGCFIRLLADAQDKTTPFKTIITAPTGKAAAHLEAALQNQRPFSDRLKCESTTLHRLLQLSPHRQQFHSERVLDADLVVVDEASMLDASLLLHLLNAIGPKTRLVLLGDPNQLPPVEGTGFFPEMAELFGEKLEESMRMGNGALMELSQAILANDPDRAMKIHSEAVEWLPWISQPLELTRWLCDLLPSPYYQQMPDPLKLLQQQKSFRILSALRQGPFGVDAINHNMMENYLEEKRSGWMAIPILIVQNDGLKQLYNGTMGVLIRQKSGSEAIAYFPSSGGVRAFSESTLPSYEIAFCLSVHKSQGSEFEETLILFGPGAERFGKEALYTAVTRAKKKVRLCIEESTFRTALLSDRQKHSGFAERIKIYLRNRDPV